MQVRNVMSSPVVSATIHTTIRDAAAMMRRHDVGALPVLDGTGAVGIVTDRDLVTRVLSREGGAGQMQVAAAMTPGPVTCSADQDVAEAAAIMGDRQVRRLLVVDRSGEIVGLLSLGDIAENASEELAGQALGEISEGR